MGAIKGAAIGKGLIVAKKALALKALAIGGALIAKPIILGAGIKAAVSLSLSCHSLFTKI